MKTKTKSSKKHLYISMALCFVIVAVSTLLIFTKVKYRDGFEQNSLTGLAVNDNVQLKAEVVDSFSNSKELHFREMPITYGLDINTAIYGKKAQIDDYEIERVKWAMDIIEKSTDGVVKFQEISDIDNANIKIHGVKDIQCGKSEDGNFLIEGAAAPVNFSENILEQSEVWYCAKSHILLEEGMEASDLSEETLLLNSKSSWRDGVCENFPIVEVHEILHALGFGHTYTDSSDIMYPIDFKIQNCQSNKINEKIVSCLKNIYSNGGMGDCSDVDTFPFEEDKSRNVTDFKWNSLPVTYSVDNCIPRQINNLRVGVKIIEKYIGYDLFELVEPGQANLNFDCEKSVNDTLLNWETDLWDTTAYFPAAQPEYYFDDNGKIKEVEINLFGQGRDCGGIEMHELLHGIGLRKHYGRWMEYERSICSEDGVIDKESINKVKEIYSLK